VDVGRAKKRYRWNVFVSLPPDPVMGRLRRFTKSHSLLFPFFLAIGVPGNAVALLFGLRRQMTPSQRMVTLVEFALGFWLGWLNFLFFAIPTVLANAKMRDNNILCRFVSPG
jgi:hypothetical protein